MGLITAFDNAIFKVLQAIANPILDAIMIFFTNLGNGGIVWIVLGIVLLFFKKTRRLGFVMLIALGIEYILNDFVIKGLVQRDRPFIGTNYELLIPAPSGYSFPSGHSASSFVCAVTLFLGNKKIGTPAFVVATIIALSRSYLYVHYPSDILCGVLLGTLIALAVYFVDKKFIRKAK